MDIKFLVFHLLKTKIMWLSSTYQEELYKKYKGLKFSPFSSNMKLWVSDFDKNFTRKGQPN